MPGMAAFDGVAALGAVALQLYLPSVPLWVMPATMWSPATAGHRHAARAMWSGIIKRRLNGPILSLTTASAYPVSHPGLHV